MSPFMGNGRKLLMSECGNNCDFAVNVPDTSRAWGRLALFLDGLQKKLQGGSKHGAVIEAIQLVKPGMGVPGNSHHSV